jgi:hypothetical protein
MARFRRADFKALPPRNWTLLVQGLNLHSDDADRLLRAFAFVPYARHGRRHGELRGAGGGVGPHFDSYDVFLLQGFGRRRWRYGRQADLSLREGLPVKILRRFTPSNDAVLSPGDMLYLPPSYAHDGVALDACTTYSIGFRAATHTEMAQSFLDHLRDRIDIPGPLRETPACGRRASRRASMHRCNDVPRASLPKSGGRHATWRISWRVPVRTQAQCVLRCTRAPAVAARLRECLPAGAVCGSTGGRSGCSTTTRCTSTARRVPGRADRAARSRPSPMPARFPRRR